ncbi:unnamed protein product [Coffea canephora]|uniref:Uncharacterized protein n=1 Tax=Coffea canephora TaxID=49390 RepID=A0A068UXZ8_COFCA|nr:unnamed protein product [Coffea canephora]
MATVTSAAVSIPSFTGLKASGAPASRVSSTVKVFAASPKLAVKASLKEVGAAVVATAASAMLATNALAARDLAWFFWWRADFRPKRVQCGFWRENCFSRTMPGSPTM